MPIAKEQIENVKNQLIQQIQSTFPEDKKISAIEQINLMNEEQLEQFLIKNNLVQSEGKEPKQQKCIFCSISEGEIPTTKIDENKDAIATLEIRPISKAHSIIIPKKHIEMPEQIPQAIFSLAKKISKRIKQKFKPKDILIYSANVFGHEILNVLPVYDKENPESERKQAREEELLELQKILEKTKKVIIKKVKIKKIKSEETKKMWWPRRLP